MTEEQIYETIDFNNEDVKSIELLKSYQPVVILPGLLIGTHKSVIEFIDFIRNKFGTSTIKVFCHTWNHEANTIWIHHLKRVCKQSSTIDLSIITEDYSDSRVLDFYSRIRKNLVGDGKIEILDSVFMKRFIVFYSMMRIYEKWLKSLPKKTYIFKFRSALAIEEDPYSEFLSHIGDYKRRAGPDTFREDYLATEPLDMFLSNTINFKGVSEVMFSTSLHTFKKIFGSSLEELSDRASSVLLSWYKRSKVEIDLNSSNFEQSTKLFSIFPYSGSLTLETLINLYAPNLMVGTTRIRHTMLNPRWSNPIINIKNGKVWTHPEKLRTDENRLHNYIINYKLIT